MFCGRTDRLGMAWRVWPGWLNLGPSCRFSWVQTRREVAAGPETTPPRVPRARRWRGPPCRTLGVRECRELGGNRKAKLTPPSGKWLNFISELRPDKQVGEMLNTPAFQKKP